MDLVVIMPHMQLAYIGIVHKCHKIIEVPWGYTLMTTTKRLRTTACMISPPMLALTKIKAKRTSATSVMTMRRVQTRMRRKNGEYDEEDDADNDDIIGEWKREAGLKDLSQYEENEQSWNKRAVSVEGGSV